MLKRMVNRLKQTVSPNFVPTLSAANSTLIDVSVRLVVDGCISADARTRFLTGGDIRRDVHFRRVSYSRLLLLLLLRHSRRRRHRRKHKHTDCRLVQGGT